MRSKPMTIAFLSMFIFGCKDGDAELDPNSVVTFLAENCPKYVADGGTLPDLASSPPKCAAAKGLTGDALICVDFASLGNQTLTTPAPAALMGWDFEQAAKGCWEIASGKLQVKNFGGFVGTCSFTMPQTDLAIAANQKYQSVTLAVVQRVDLNDKPAQLQTAQLMLGIDSTSRQFATATGTNPQQQNIYALTKSAVQTITSSGNFQPLFKLTSPLVAPGNTGVQIDSIAVMGNP